MRRFSAMDLSNLVTSNNKIHIYIGQLQDIVSNILDIRINILDHYRNKINIQKYF